ncbi:MAG TPA: SGNH/GDSL hydrolase family protein, partial [Planctomycetota bacterium]|nr:SGNH/GDSL hydrolase family protein [Planctomycetota bacterium]
LSGATHGGMHNAELSQVKTLAPEALATHGAANRFVSGGTHFAIEGVARGPALELSEEETDLALRMFERSLAWTVRRFERSRIHVVYLPSPLSCYELESSEVNTRVADASRPTAFPASAVTQRSDVLRDRVRAFAAKHGVAFIDATPELRAAARAELVHGPKDAGHFNRTGYTVLGELLARELQTGAAKSR